MKNFKKLLLIVFILMGTALFSQTIVSGVVKDNQGTPMPGVNVLVSGTSTGTTTDINGAYALTIPSTVDNPVLVFSYLGFLSVDEPVNGKRQISITLIPDQKQLDEVVVVGYSSQSKRTITSAIGTVDMGDFEKRRVPNVAQALQGQIAGVQITSSTGAPGDPIEVRIRGNGTIGNNDPLYIIDGIPSRDISFITPQDIESLNVLKDAAASSIYGARASAGVVIITTKKGNTGKPSLTVDAYSAIQRVTNLPNLLNTEQYLKNSEKAFNNAGFPGPNPYTAAMGRTDLADVDYLDELFETGTVYSVQVSSSGGSENMQYYLSGGYYEEDGIVVFDNDKFQRVNFRTNLNAQFSPKFKFGTNLQLVYSSRDQISSKGDAPGVIRHALIRPPVIPVRKDPNDPTFSPENPFTDLPFFVSPDQFDSDLFERSQNPIALAYFSDDETNDFRTFGNVFAEYAFLKDNSLKLRTNIGVDLNFSHRKTFNENFGDDDGGGGSLDQGLGRLNRPNQLSESRTQTYNYTWNNTLNYTKEFGNHSVNVLIGSEYLTNKESNLGASRNRFDFSDDQFRFLDFGGFPTDINNGGTASEWSLLSYFGSATYMYENRYILTGSIRRDGSSKFSDDNRWGNFPSVSTGWIASRENFMKDISWLSELKFRGSWGVLGNQEIPDFAFLTLFRKDNDKFVISRFGNPDLKWESTTQYNGGFDLGLFNNKLLFSFDYFNKRTSDILLPISLPQLVGDVSPTFVNAGKVNNKGVEFGINYRNQINQFKYTINANVSTLKNRVLQLHPNLPNISGSVTRTEVGHPLNSFFGLVFDGIYQTPQEVAEHLNGVSNPSAVPGDIKFKDLDGNGIINDNDRDFIGNPNPMLMYGFNFSAEFKNFDLGIFFQGVSGVEKYNDLKKILDFDTRPFNSTTNVLNAWDGAGSSNSIPRVSFTDNGSSKVSSIFVEDASYLRLKNIELGYTFNTLADKLGLNIQELRVYFSAQNLFTITNYGGLDPESSGLVDQGTFPLSQVFTLGFHLSF